MFKRRTVIILITILIILIGCSTGCSSFKTNTYKFEKEGKATLWLTVDYENGIFSLYIHEEKLQDDELKSLASGRIDDKENVLVCLCSDHRTQLVFEKARWGRFTLTLQKEQSAGCENVFPNSTEKIVFKRAPEEILCKRSPVISKGFTRHKGAQLIKVNSAD